MSKFLTPPVWHDGYGTLNDMLTGKSVEEGNVVIGSSAEASANVFNSVIIFGSATGTQSAPTSNAIIAGVGASAGGAGVIAIGAGSSATAEGTVASGFSAQAKNTGAIAIGRNASAEAFGAIAIGDGASASSQNTIQLGSSSNQYNLTVGNGYGAINGVNFSSVFKTVGSEKMASKAFTIYNKISTDNESNIVNFSGLNITGKYLIAIRYAFKDQTTGGLTREPEGSAFIVVNQNYPVNTVTYGDLSAGYTNGQMAFVFPKYTKTDSDAGKLQMQKCSSTGNISNDTNIDIIVAYAILLDT